MVPEMPDLQQFTSVSFCNYKALRRYSVALSGFNVLVGPNNSGKSTILGAFRMLAEGIRKASSRNPERIDLQDGRAWGYHMPLDDLPVATENIFSDYDDSQPALVDFRLSGGNRLELVFPESNVCYLVCTTTGRPVRSTSDQVLRSAPEPLQGWTMGRPSATTEGPLEFVEAEAMLMSLPLQHRTGREAARDLMEWRPRGAGLTAGQPEVLLTDTKHFLTLGTETLQATDLCRRQGAASGGDIRVAVSDDQDVHTPRQPTALRPVWGAPKGPERLAIEAASLLQATANIPAIVPDPFPQRFRRILGVADRLRATAQAMAGIAAELQGQQVLRRAPAVPKSQAQGDPKLPISPHEQHQGEAIHRPPLLGGRHPGQALHRRRDGLRNHRVVAAEIASVPDAPGATGQFQECVPGPFSVQSSRHVADQARTEQREAGRQADCWSSP
jgi:hypothetical protein